MNIKICILTPSSLVVPTLEQKRRIICAWEGFFPRQISIFGVFENHLKPIDVLSSNLKKTFCDHFGIFWDDFCALFNSCYFFVSDYLMLFKISSQMRKGVLLVLINTLPYARNNTFRLNSVWGAEFQKKSLRLRDL